MSVPLNDTGIYAELDDPAVILCRGCFEGLPESSHDHYAELDDEAVAELAWEPPQLLRCGRCSEVIYTLRGGYQ